MNTHLTGIIKSNWFFVALIGFVLVLPFSQALVSVFSGVILVVALVEDTWANKLIRVKKNKYLLSISVIFIIYLVSSFLTFNGDRPFYDVQKTMFYIVIPLAFVLGKGINVEQKRILFYVFTASVFFATIITIFEWNSTSNNVNFEIHKASPISHIRFSFQLILLVWFFIISAIHNFNKVETKIIVLYLVFAIYFMLFLLFQQSLTGIVALGSSVIFILFYLICSERKKLKIPLVLATIVIVILPVLYVSFAINKFYDIETIAKDDIEIYTVKGNHYKHHFDRKDIENGKYVYLYMCTDEMQKEWNTVSDIKYDEIGKNGYPIYASLIRYLTSKGLRKDAEGVKALSLKDIENIENGMSNYIFEKKYSLYPRIYQTIWEYYTYTTTGNPNHQSFSQRIEFAKAAITIIKQNFWFGVGTGNWRNEFNQAYKKNNSQLQKELYGSAHNQYLNFTVKFGVIGFCFIMFLIIYPIIQTKRYTDILFLTFLVFMFFANFADSNLESHMGSSFFVFFYCIFITGEINYLSINNGKNGNYNINV